MISFRVIAKPFYLFSFATNHEKHYRCMSSKRKATAASAKKRKAEQKDTEKKEEEEENGEQTVLSMRSFFSKSRETTATVAAVVEQRPLQNGASDTGADTRLREECEAARYALAMWCSSCFAPRKVRVRAEECYVRDAMRERLQNAISMSIKRQKDEEKKLRLIDGKSDTDGAGDDALDGALHATVIERVLFWRWYYLHPAMYRQRCRQIEFNLAQNGWYMLTHFGPLTICAFSTRKLAENTSIEEWRAEHRRRLLHDLKPPTPKIDEKGTFQCGKCKSWRTTYYPLQTRGGDESMTNFVTCHDCNNHFRKS